jgi:hypothetical protein
MSPLTIPFTLAGIITLILVALAMCRAAGDADEADEKLWQERAHGDWPHVPPRPNGWIDTDPNFYVHPSAGSSPGDSKGAALSRNGGAPVSDLLHSTGNSRRRPQDHA